MIYSLGFGMTLVSFGLAMLTAHALLKLKLFGFLLDRKKEGGVRYTSLDGMRGFLAISVFFHHFIFTWYWKVNGVWSIGPQEHYFYNYGKVGVALFFMITGFLFISKIIKNKGKINWLNLYESRLFRIFPLYIFALIIISFVVLSRSSYELNVSFLSLVKQYFYWLVFHGGNINDFSNTRLIIAGVDWTLKYEWFFYLFLPVLSLLFVKLGKIASISLLLLCAFFFVNPIRVFQIDTSLLVFFAFGGIAAYVVQLYKPPMAIITGNIISSIVGLALISSLFYHSTFDAVHVILIFIAFILVVLGNDLFGIFSLKSSVLLGEISYSIYLLHGVVLYFSFTFFSFVDIKDYTLQEYLIFMPAISILVIILSVLTFMLIERPSIVLGRKYYLSNILLRFRFNANKLDKCG